MIRRCMAFCMVFALGLIASTTAEASSNEANRYIGLHDRLLSFDQNEMHEVENQLFVSFDTLMKYLYVEVVYDDVIHASKNNHVISYNRATKITYLNGKESKGTPLREINGTLYADVAYVAKSYGFHFEYFPEFNVSRIFSDDYKSLRGVAYEKHMRKTLKIRAPHIGLHDRLLAFNQDDICSVNGKIVVPFKELMNYLYVEVKQGDPIHASKNKYVLTYNQKTGTTAVDGKESDGTPIFLMNGKLYADISYVAESFGFRFEYIPEINVSRIFSDSYKSLRGTAYVNHVKALVEPVVPTPKPPMKPQKANVYLTFDDGPTSFTSVNAATLKKYKVQGTFFFLGSQMSAYPATVKAVAKEGHYIGSHSMTHEQKKVYASTTSFMNEMSGAASIIHNLTGSHPKLIRVPYGSKPHVTTAMKNQLKKQNFKMWDWDVDANDWKYSDKQYTEIVKNVRAGVEKAYKSGDREIVVLLHDRSQTAKALPQIIEWLQKQGYTIKKYDPAHHVVQNFHRDTGL